MSDAVELVHPDSDQVIEVAARVADRYLANGWRHPESGIPKGNASLADWQDYARLRGFTEDDLEDKTRDELRAALA